MADKSHRVIVALDIITVTMRKNDYSQSHVLNSNSKKMGAA